MAARRKLLKQALEPLRETLHPLNAELYATRAALFDCVVACQPVLAFKLCRAMVRFLAAVYIEVPHHPMLALYRITLGDLAVALRSRDGFPSGPRPDLRGIAAEAFGEARRTLRLLHGPNHPLVEHCEVGESSLPATDKEA
eukprot:Polyplicarium_translucidae@DN1680_c0_g1_i4.p3